MPKGLPAEHLKTNGAEKAIDILLLLAEEIQNYPPAFIINYLDRLLIRLAKDENKPSLNHKEKMIEALWVFLMYFCYCSAKNQDHSKIGLLSILILWVFSKDAETHSAIYNYFCRDSFPYCNSNDNFLSYLSRYAGLEIKDYTFRIFVELNSG